MKKLLFFGILAAIGIIGILFFRKGASRPASDPPNLALPNSGRPAVLMQTNLGEIQLLLWPQDAPNTAENFLTLAASGFYDGVKFHRVIKGFMIQGGDPLSKDNTQKNRWGTGGPGYVFADEIHEHNRNMAGTIAMANAGPDTNGSQFFINTADNNFLDAKHTVFGEVIAGMEIVRKIENAATEGPDRPVSEVVIERVRVLQD